MDDADLPSCWIPKPARGTAKKARRARTLEARDNERYEKAKVREREDRVAGSQNRDACRWRHLDPDDRDACRRAWREVSHQTHKGLGGDKQTIRSRRHRMLNVCVPTHRKIDAGLARWEPLEGAHVGSDGPIVCFERRTVHDAWVEVGRELRPGVWAPRR